MAGHNSSRPHEADQDCSECDYQDSWTVRDVIVRVSRESDQICCVEWPLIRAEETAVAKNPVVRLFEREFGLMELPERNA